MCCCPKSNDYTVSDDRWVLECYHEYKDDSPEAQVKAVLTSEKMWNQDLTQATELEERITHDLKLIRTKVL